MWTILVLMFLGCDTVNQPVFDGTVKDIDGNVYHTVTIGTQTWMIENLKTEHYSDSTVIPMVTDSATWANLATPGYCWYGNDSTSNKAVYGALYNWYAVNTGKLAPKGWHVPTESDWAILENNVANYLYSSGSLAKILASTTKWPSSANTGAIGNNLTLNNSSGFGALPGGARDTTHFSFNSKGIAGNWWGNTLKSDTTALSLHMSYDSGEMERIYKRKWNGLSVRCVKD